MPLRVYPTAEEDLRLRMDTRSPPPPSATMRKRKPTDDPNDVQLPTPAKRLKADGLADFGLVMENLYAARDAIGVLPVNTRIPLVQAIELCNKACGANFPTQTVGRLAIVTSFVTRSPRLVKLETATTFIVK
jgi:hypothetical protein